MHEVDVNIKKTMNQEQAKLCNQPGFTQVNHRCGGGMQIRFHCARITELLSVINWSGDNTTGDGIR